MTHNPDFDTEEKASLPDLSGWSQKEVEALREFTNNWMAMGRLGRMAWQAVFFLSALAAGAFYVISMFHGAHGATIRK